MLTLFSNFVLITKFIYLLFQCFRKAVFQISKKFLILHWNVAKQQCCDSFRWTTEELSHIYTCVHSSLNSPATKFVPNILFVSWFAIVVYSLSCVQIFCNPMDGSLPGSSVHGIFQARIQVSVAISYSRSIMIQNFKICL